MAMHGFESRTARLKARELKTLANEPDGRNSNSGRLLRPTHGGDDEIFSRILCMIHRWNRLIM